MRMKFLLSGLLMMISLSALAAPKAKLWSYWQASQAEASVLVDHTAWSDFLGRYVDTREQPHRLNYGGVSKPDKAKLESYLDRLQSLDPLKLTPAQQKAYWINLYNAATVNLVLDNYPVKSITKIKSGFFSFGPWDKDLLQVNGKNLTLNDIEHRILRPIFKDARIHYAVNCASIGCPNLAAEAYTAKNSEALLEQGAHAYINDERGVKAGADKLTVSSIYEWFAVDFGGTQAAVIKHLRQYADTELKARLASLDTIDGYHYDWSLNDQR